MVATDKLPNIFKTNGSLYSISPASLGVGKTIVIGSDGKWTTVAPLTPASSPNVFPDLSSVYIPIISPAGDGNFAQINPDGTLTDSDLSDSDFLRTGQGVSNDGSGNLTAVSFIGAASASALTSGTVSLARLPFSGTGAQSFITDPSCIASELGSVAIGPGSVNANHQGFAVSGNAVYGHYGAAFGLTTAAAGIASMVWGSNTQSGNTPRACTISGATLTIAGVNAVAEFGDPTGQDNIFLLFNAGGAWGAVFSDNASPPNTGQQSVRAGALAISYDGTNTIITLPNAFNSGISCEIVSTRFGTLSGVLGQNGKSLKRSAFVISCSTNALGRAQNIRCTANADTIDATQTLLYVHDGQQHSTGGLPLNVPDAPKDGISPLYVLHNNTAYSFTIDVVGWQSGSANQFSARRRVTAANNGGTLVLGRIDTLGVDMLPAGWGGLVIQANSTYQTLDLLVTGKAATNISWMATIDANELGNL